MIVIDTKSVCRKTFFAFNKNGSADILATFADTMFTYAHDKSFKALKNTFGGREKPYGRHDVFYALDTDNTINWRTKMVYDQYKWKSSMPKKFFQVQTEMGEYHIGTDHGLQTANDIFNIEDILAYFLISKANHITNNVSVRHTGHNDSIIYLITDNKAHYQYYRPDLIEVYFTGDASWASADNETNPITYIKKSILAGDKKLNVPGAHDKFLKIGDVPHGFMPLTVDQISKMMGLSGQKDKDFKAVFDRNKILLDMRESLVHSFGESCLRTGIPPKNAKDKRLEMEF